MDTMSHFRSKFAEDIFKQKYAHDGAETWDELALTLVNDVCGTGVNTKILEPLLSEEDCETLIKYIEEMKFIPGGRYLYYAGRKKKFYNNCYLLRAETDTREDWANLSYRCESCLITGGGIGVDYSVYRPSNTRLKHTGGLASGPIPKMRMINEIGRHVMQGGARRSAIYASLNWQHGDIREFLKCKNWYDMPIPGTDKTLGQIKELEFNFPAPLDMTNISVNYDTDWLLDFWNHGSVGDVFKANVKQAMMTGEPGFSFNFFGKENETLRNACTEVTSADDSDVCNLGSINFGNIENISELRDVVDLATKFLICGTLRADLPYPKVGYIRKKNRRLGLGLMGLHEWLLKKNCPYEVTTELHRWLTVYQSQSDKTAFDFANHLSISQPVAKRAIAPTGTIGIMAGEVCRLAA